MNLLDERIDYHQSVDRETGVETRAYFIAKAQYKGIADTIVQLIRRLTSGVIPSIAADSVGKATLTKTGLAATLACREKNDEYYR